MPVGKHCRRVEERWGVRHGVKEGHVKEGRACSAQEGLEYKGKLVVPPGYQASDWKGDMGNSNSTLSR